MYAYELTAFEKENLMVAKKIAAVTLPISAAHKIDTTLMPGVYRTRNGRKATILSAGVPGDFCLIGFIEAKTGAVTPTTWRAEGRAAVEQNDLVSIWSDTRDVTVDLYIGLDESGAAVLSYTPPKSGDFIGIKKVTVTVTEGDTLDGGKKD